MKATELQIGDWVCYDGDTEYTTPVKVDGLTTDDISLDGEGFLGGIEDMVIPIPLTPKILKKNGFTLTNEDYFRNDDGIKISVSFENEDQFPAIFISSEGEDKSYMELIYPIGHIIYVHELQRALRCCELWDLAENFKCRVDMEHKIGAIISLPDGRKAEVVEKDGGCDGCILDGMEARLCANSPCLPEERTDHKNIIYKEIKDE